MTEKRFISVFEAIGPVMVGPSSSHTAGAVRLGLMGRALLGSTPQNALIRLHGSFAKTGRGHGTDRAIIAGLLGLGTADQRIRLSHTLAGDCGLAFSFEEIDLGADVHPNSAQFILSAGERQVTFTGSSLGGGRIEIIDLQGYPVSFNGEYCTLIIISADQPGTINTITGWLAEAHINIAFLKVERQKIGEEAIMIIETDQPVTRELSVKIASLPWVRWSRIVPKLGD